MYKRLMALLLAGLCFVPSGAAATENGAPTQRQWMVNLVSGMGWSFGLPDEPEDEDFLPILQGERRVRLEAEKSHRPDDMVAVKRHTVFGPFSGDGWLSGIARPTTAHLDFLLPRGGDYRVTAALRLPEWTVAVDGRTFSADGGREFTEVDLGNVSLAPGEVTVEVSVPPNGAIDYLEFNAPPLPPVEPLGGWRPEETLTLDDLAVTAIRMFALEELLPPSGERREFEVESAGILDGARRVTVRHLGAPSGGAWVRATNRPAQVQMQIVPPAPGVYTLRLRAEGEGELGVSLGDGAPVLRSFPPFLSERSVGTFLLDEGPTTARLNLPPRGGADLLALTGHRSDGKAFRRLAGLPLEGQTPSPRQMDRLLALLAAIGAPN